LGEERNTTPFARRRWPFVALINPLNNGPLSARRFSPTSAFWSAL
jgi:hypothetical protein